MDKPHASLIPARALAPRPQLLQDLPAPMERHHLMPRIQQRRRAHLLRQRARPRRQNRIVLPPRPRLHMLPQERDQHLRRRPRGELLEVVALVRIRVIHHPLHHDPRRQPFAYASAPIGGRLHLHARAPCAPSRRASRTPRRPPSPCSRSRSARRARGTRLAFGSASRFVRSTSSMCARPFAVSVSFPVFASSPSFRSRAHHRLDVGELRLLPASVSGSPPRSSRSRTQSPCAS